MRPPQGMRARKIAEFQAERQRIRTVIDSIWTRDKSVCQVCKQHVVKLGTTPKQTGYVRFTDPKHPTVEMGRLLCGEHFHGRSKIRAPKFVLVT